MNDQGTTTAVVALTSAEKKYIESQGDPGTDFYWMAIERVISDRIAAQA